MAVILVFIFLGVIYDRLAKDYDQSRIWTILRGYGAFILVPIVAAVISHLVSTLFDMKEQVAAFNKTYLCLMTIVSIVYTYSHYQRLKRQWQ